MNFYILFLISLSYLYRFKHITYALLKIITYHIALELLKIQNLKIILWSWNMHIMAVCVISWDDRLVLLEGQLLKVFIIFMKKTMFIKIFIAETF